METNKYSDNKYLKPVRFEKTAGVLKCIAHPVRLLVLEILGMNMELTVSEIIEKTGVEQSLLSHHLNKMKDKGVLKAERDGKNIFYSISDHQIVRVLDYVEVSSV
jgi:DNA-binding transcriptional ArsR family regulator